jgi:hypothetical protein
VFIIFNKEWNMKKVLFGMLALIGLVVSLYAGVLTGSEISGTKTYCYYSDGDIKVIDGMGICPATN